MAKVEQPGDEFKPGESSESVVSLSQVLLAPLDALFKAQVHAGRSFLNFVLQLSYEHKPRDASGQPSQNADAEPAPDKIFAVDFVQEIAAPTDIVPSGVVRQKVSVPALALVPLRPLAIEEASIDLAMTVTHVAEHRQLRKHERDKESTEEEAQRPPWYLVDDPISLRGNVAATSEGAGDLPKVHVRVKVSSVPTPSGLDKLLTTLTQAAQVQNVPSKPSDK